MSISAGFIIKPNVAVSLIFCGLVSLYILAKDREINLAARAKVFILPLCAGGIWVARNIIQSGYPLFPLPFFAAPFDWTMPLQQVRGNYDAILGWARMHGADYLKSLENGFSFWFTPWIISNLRSYRFRISIAYPLIISIVLWSRVLITRFTKTILLFFTWSLFSIAYWFLAAPDMRFGSGFFWTSLALSALFLAPSKFKNDPQKFLDNKKIKNVALGIWILVFVYCCIVQKLLSPDHSFLYVNTMPSNAVKEYIADSAGQPFIVWIPYYDGDDRCGNAPLPCAPYPKTLDNIEMRGYDTFKNGFRPKTKLAVADSTGFL
jgi:hypothetical protein